MQRLQGPTAALLTDPEWHDFLFHQIETEYALRSGRMLEDVQVGAVVQLVVRVPLTSAGGRAGESAIVQVGVSHQYWGVCT